MVQKKIGVFLSLMFLFLVSSVSALTIQKSPVNDVIVPEFNQPAVFSLTPQDIPADYYQAYTLTDVALAPKGFFYISPGSSFNLNVYPTDNLNVTGYLQFSYFLKQQNGENYADKLIVKVVSLKNLIEIKSDYIDPSNEKITFFIENKENANLYNIKARFYSDFFDEEQTFNLTAYQKTEISVVANKEKMQTINAGSYIINADFYTDKGVQKLQGKLLLVERKSILTQESSSGTLVHQASVKKTNNGNVQTLVSVTMKRDIFSRLFTSFNVNPTDVDRKGLMVTYTWNQKLNPSESLSVEARTNYIFPVLTILFAIIIILGFKRLTKAKAEIKKSVSYIKTKNGEFALKVRVTVKAKKALQKVSLIDNVPGVVQIYDKYWTIKPSKVDSINRRITWDLGDMASGEERSFTYVVYSRVGVVGKFSMPEALLVFEQDGKLHEAESNKVFFLSEQITREE